MRNITNCPLADNRPLKILFLSLLLAFGVGLGLGIGLGCSQSNTQVTLLLDDPTHCLQQKNAEALIIEALLDELDPYSYYLPAETIQTAPLPWPHGFHPMNLTESLPKDQT